MATLQSLIVNDTGNLTLPSGSTGQRPTLTTNIVRWTNTGTQAVSVLAGSATTTTTSWTCPTGVTSIEVLVVAGGGAGGQAGGSPYAGGGGGAGGVIYNASFPVTPATVYTVTVGAGGLAAAAAASAPLSGTAGGNSIFGSLTAIGGGYGANYTNQTGGTGGSGGGGTAASVVTLSNPPGQGTAGQGYAGGYGHQDNVSQGGGGGGAGGVGTTVWQSGVYPTFAGHGGPGVAYNISGTFTWYAGGGGGSGESTVYGDGGIGGGGRGGVNSGSAGTGTSGTASTGGGGGGASRGNWKAGDGGSGVVIIRYATTATTTLPLGETRYNSTLNVVETYNNKNAWVPRVSTTKSEPNTANGLILNLDPSNYVSGTTWIDTSGLNNHATLYNTPTYTASTNNGGYFTLNGTNQYMDFGSNYVIPNAVLQSNPPDELTINVWVNWASIGNGGNDEIISWWSGNVSDTLSDGFLGSTSAGNIRWGDANQTSIAPFNTTTDINKWINITAIYTVNNGYIYINGALRFTKGSAMQFGINAYPAIGRHPASAEYFNGRIGLFQMWNRALTAAEIRNNYNTQSTRYATNVYLDKPAIVQNGLIFNVDASDPSSNPGITTGAEGYTSNVAFWYDTAGGQHLGLLNYPKFTTAYGAPALLLNGSNQTAQTLSNISMTFNGGHTIEAWAYYTTVSRSQGTLEVGTQVPNYINFYMNSSNVMRLEDFTGSNGAANDINSTTAVVANKWYHFVGVLTNSATNNNNLLELYVNGVRETVGTQTSPFQTSVTGPIKLGAYAGYMSGAIGAIRIYNRPLTGNEVQQNFQSTRGRYGI